jgi:hypothetical protein
MKREARHGLEPAVGGAEMKAWMIGLPAAGVAALALFLFLHRPTAPGGRENAIFENDCCGTLELRDGAMVLNGKQNVAYVVGRDGRGPYILPHVYVGAYEDIGFEVDGTRPATRLRLDRLPRPSSILLYAGARPFLFKSKVILGKR